MTNMVNWLGNRLSHRFRILILVLCHMNRYWLLVPIGQEIHRVAHPGGAGFL